MDRQVSLVLLALAAGALLAGCKGGDAAPSTPATVNPNAVQTPRHLQINPNAVRPQVGGKAGGA